MQNKRNFLFFMIGLAAALSLSAAFTRSNVLQGLAAPLTNPASQEKPSSAEIAETGYTLTWSTIDGGGGEGKGGSYELKYTIGQPDATQSEGSPFARHGGFWPGVIQFWLNFLPIAIR